MRLAGFTLLAALRLGAQELVVREAPLPAGAVDVLLWDADSDGRGDLLATAPGPRCVLRLRVEGGGFGSARVAAAPADADGFSAARAPEGAPALAFDGPDGLRLLRLGDFREGSDARGGDGAAPPPFRGFAEDLDGDGAPDPLASRADGAVLYGSRAGARPIRLPTERRLAAGGGGGLVTATTRAPRATFARLRAGEAPRPAWFEGGALRALRGSAADGFGPDAEILARFSDEAPAEERVLERNEPRLADLDGDGIAEAVLGRVRTRAGALGGARTEILVRRLGADAPAQALLLPGVLSSGPDLRDLDGDGRLDLVATTFADDLASQLSRGLRGAVRLTAFVYRGAPGPASFRRAPDLALADDVPEAHFERWDLRHRLLFGDDWTGDGRPDLLAVKVERDRATATVRAGVAGADGALAFAEAPWREATVPASFVAFAPWRLAASEPALLARSATTAWFVSAR
ncbi:MAG TPA: hypothetical protein VEI02_11195 [Planctomycetota bacterium]|nr:hypothetical protein [Planctomycetota bacterium]